MKIEVKVEELRKKKLFLATPMYGGACMGLYTRSMLDLSAMCKQYGIEMKVYFLFNESLIQRARNYCCDEFLRSDSTHFMFIDADIGFNPNDIITMLAMMTDDGPYQVLTGPYPKKSVAAGTKIHTENGQKTIQWICSNKYKGKALSINNKTGKFEFKNIINHYTSKSSSKRWIKIKLGNQKSVEVTCDHEMAVIDDIFNPSIHYEEARFCQGKYLARFPNTQLHNNNENSLYNKDQISALVGTVLGDGSIDSTGYLKFGHCIAQSDYILQKQKLFGGKLSEVRKVGSYKDKEYFASFLECPRNEQIVRLREMVYESGKKTLKSVLHMFDEKSLAFLYMDDGSLYNQGNCSAILCTEALSFEDQKLFSDMMQEKFGIKTNIQHHGDSWRIYIPVDSCKIFFKLIAPFVFQSMNHKLPEEYHSIEKYAYDINRLEYSTRKVETKSITDSHPRREYDIEVEDNHNFVANHFVSHNCISWEKIKHAVDKGLADDNPQNLENYVGDYVFNPADGTGSFAVSEPVRISEGGTGFMMIRRDVFAKFNEAYPEQSYKPDHVRTDHFDGSREITAFFDCVIDPVSKRYLSEDYMFCYYCRKIGIDVWLLPWMKLQHVGTMIFGGSLADIAQLGVSATADVSMLKKGKK